ncbi:hypothetical protein [Streptomyces sp. OE57]|uniref:hypothetical protein n=1 Tax=Streptomyces lacaronensis TaxID=3379885 RepID=UPI0039B742FC
MVGEVLLHFVERGGAAQVGDPAQHRAGPGHQRGDHLEERLLAPALLDVVAVEVLRVGDAGRGLVFRPVGRADGTQ